MNLNRNTSTWSKTCDNYAGIYKLNLLTVGGRGRVRVLMGMCVINLIHVLCHFRLLFQNLSYFFFLRGQHIK